MLPIGISAKEDTAARFLISHLRTHGNQSNIQKVLLDYEIKVCCHQMFRGLGLHRPDTYDADSTYTTIMQLGKTPAVVWAEFQDALSKIHDAVWVSLIMETCKDIDTLVITSIFKENEIKCIHDRGGFIINIDGPEGLDYEYTITNKSDLNKLNTEIVEIIQEVRL
jgi:hypothetical protein